MDLTLTVAEATKLADVIMILAPDEIQLKELCSRSPGSGNAGWLSWFQYPLWIYQFLQIMKMSSCVNLKDQDTWYRTYEGFGVPALMQFTRCNRKCRKTLLWTGVKVLNCSCWFAWNNLQRKNWKICLVNKLYCGGLTAAIRSRFGFFWVPKLEAMPQGEALWSSR